MSHCGKAEAGWIKCGIKIKYLYRNHSACRAQRSNTVETVSLWRYITVLQLINWLGKKAKSETQYYFTDERKHFIKYLMRQLLTITDRQVNSLMSYLKTGEIFGFLLAFNVFQLCFKGFMLKTKETLRCRGWPPSWKQVISTGAHQQRGT